jgi:hypothetical protein
LFGIPDTIQRRRIRPDDRRRHYGTGQGTASNFIDAGHPAISPGTRVFFETH